MWGDSKVIRLLSIIHNGIILDLLCVGLVVVLVRMFVLVFLCSERENLFLFMVEAVA